MQAKATFGTKGYAIASGFLSTVVVGWYAFQTGLTGATVHTAFGWNATAVIVFAMVLYTFITFLGIKALAIVCLIGVPFLSGCPSLLSWVWWPRGSTALPAS
jgi:cytosine permease